jgi:alpha-beta hydrolase superfamily lysophospholipase
VLAVVHGLGDHSGRFAGLGSWFAERGIEVYCYDQFGHGKSPGGGQAVPSYRSLLEDVESFLTQIRARCPDCAVVLLGQSMGGNLVLNHQLRGYRRVDLLIAGSPMLRAAHPPGRWRMGLYRGLAKLAPSYRLDLPVEAADLTRDPDHQRAFREDRLVQHGISLRLAAALIDSGAWAIEHASELPTPTLLTHGDADAITCHRATLEFVQASGGRATELIYPGGRHDLHHDLVREAYLAALLDWILAAR